MQRAEKTRHTECGFLPSASICYWSRPTPGVHPTRSRQPFLLESYCNAEHLTSWKIIDVLFFYLRITRSCQISVNGIVSI